MSIPIIPGGGTSTTPINDIDSNLFDVNPRDTIRSIFNTTTCYDLMQTSCKAVVFEISIPFQLAFFAMIENETEVAPLWDPDRRQYIGLLTTSDYINALRICLSRNVTMMELSSKTIAEILSSQVMSFTTPYFDSIDPEESIYHLCRTLYQTKADFAPIVDPETGNLVTILGYLDIVHFVDSAAKQCPNLFSNTLDQLNIVQRDVASLVTLKRSCTIHEALNIFEQHGISGAPVVDENTGRVINFYHKADVTFINKAAEIDNILYNLRDMSIGEAISHREQLIASGEAIVTTQGLVTCTTADTIHAILNAMMIYRVTKVVVVDQRFFCVGLVSIKDILAYYLTNGSLP